MCPIYRGCICMLQSEKSNSRPGWVKFREKWGMIKWYYTLILTGYILLFHPLYFIVMPPKNSSLHWSVSQGSCVHMKKLLTFNRSQLSTSNVWVLMESSSLQGGQNKRKQETGTGCFRRSCKSIFVLQVTDLI